ncbi:MAG: hypothetical protein A2V66_18300 [Ignavibacteria bacterium RBG_13_36_8]|nr:MAG: hypothetical protein A2V66_18300 [Ignavibacteria bacterium RBG_13_36_8]
MPHCIIEYSANIKENVNKNALLLEINKTLDETKMFSLNDIKSRIIVHDDYCVGDGDPSRAFVTLNVSIISGRDSDTKKIISDLCLDLLKKHFSESLKRLKLSLTVQISELDKDSYGREKSY